MLREFLHTRGTSSAWLLSLAVGIGLVLALPHQWGLGADYDCTSAAALSLFSDGRYDPWRAACHAPYPPYFYAFYQPFAVFSWGYTASVALGIAAFAAVARAAGGGAGAILLLTLSTQNFSAAVYNNPQFMITLAFALLLWAWPRADTRRGQVLAGSALFLLLAKPQQTFLVPLALALVLPLRATLRMGLVAAALFGVSFLVHGFWPAELFRYLTANPAYGPNADSLLGGLESLGAPAALTLGLRLALIGVFAAAVMRSRRRPAAGLLATTAAVGISAIIAPYANLNSSHAVLGVTVGIVPLAWSAALIGAHWAYVLLHFTLTGQFVTGFGGLTVPVCLGLLWLADRVATSAPVSGPAWAGAGGGE